MAQVNAQHIANAISRKLGKSSGPAGDTKYDIFDRGGPNGEPRQGRAQLRHNRTGQTPRRRRRRRPSAPTSGGAAPGEMV